MPDDFTAAREAWLTAHASLQQARDALAQCPPSTIADALVELAAAPAPDRTQQALAIDLAGLASLAPDAGLKALMRAAGTSAPQLRERIYDLLVELAHARFAAFMQHTEAGLRGALPPAALAQCLRALAEVVEEGALSLLFGALDHPEAEVVAASLGALLELAEYGDLPDVVLEKARALANDQRPVEYDLGGVTEHATVGDLATALLDDAT